MKLQASAHATSWVIRRRKSTIEPQLSMNPPANPTGSVPQKQPAHPIFNHGQGEGTRRFDQIITFYTKQMNGYTLNMYIYAAHYQKLIAKFTTGPRGPILLRDMSAKCVHICWSYLIPNPINGFICL